MKIILVDAVSTLVVDGLIDHKLLSLLDSYKNKKIILTNANDEQIISFGLTNLPYDLYTLKHNPNKIDPKYFEKMLNDFDLKKEDVIYFEHSIEAVKSAESIGIKSFHFDQINRNIKELKSFLDKNIYGKDFDKWNTLKKEIQINISESGLSVKKSAFFSERDIVWISCGLNLGIESDGKGDLFLRPALILRKFNKNHFVVLMCTTTQKDNPYYFKIKSENDLLKDTKVILSQVKVIDRKRIVERLITISEKDFSEVKNKFLEIINNSPSLFGEGEANAHK